MLQDHHKPASSRNTFVPLPVFGAVGSHQGPSGELWVLMTLATPQGRPYLLKRDGCTGVCFGGKIAQKGPSLVIRSAGFGAGDTSAQTP